MLCIWYYVAICRPAQTVVGPVKVVGTEGVFLMQQKLTAATVSEQLPHGRYL